MNDELKKLKSLVRRFLELTEFVPLRPIDLNGTQEEAYELLAKLRAASRPSKKTAKNAGRKAG